MEQSVIEKDVSKKLEELAKELVNSTQIPHQYFEAGSLLLINVSSGPDALQEYSVFKKCEDTQSYYRFDSLTVSWFEVEKLSELLIRVL